MNDRPEGLLIPAFGLMHVFVLDPQPDRRAILASVGGTGALGNVWLQAEGRDFGNAWFLLDEEPAALNERARQVGVMLTGAHIAFRGPVLFDNLDEDTIADLLDAL